MSDDEEDRFLKYECRFPTAFWGEEWAASEAEKPDAPKEYIARLLKYTKPTKKTEAYYNFKTREGETGKIPLKLLKEYRAQGRFEG